MTSTSTDAKTAANEIVETIKTLVYALLIALVLRVLLFQPFTIPSESMEPGLLVGDYVVITKFDYGWSRHSIPFSPPLPHGMLFQRQASRGDIVVFKRPEDPGGEDVIKRVIGLPGDRIQVMGGAVYVNGRPIPRTEDGFQRDPGDAGVTVERFWEQQGAHRYVTLDRGQGHDGDDTGVYVVPEDHYFVMGDNRDNSADSRWPAGVGMGFVPAENVQGKARFILLSWKPGASILKPWTWLNLRGGRFLRVLS
jgi:signal peptidase I